MWQKILVAVDLSPIAEIVFDRAINLAKTSGASLILLHVLSSDEEEAPTPVLYSVEYPLNQQVVEEYQKQWQAFQAKGFAALEAMKNEAIKQDVNTEIMQIFGRPERIISKQAKQSAVSLIIMGNRGRSGLKELFLGSVSNYVIHHSHCDVLIVRPSNQ